ncbi:transducin-like enhancer protein 6 [Octodon degus]|uniref:Transducin-like enhancer protein 6 n=1 Tax=Octodon degus TaxID=10160 RepID=A0A6P6EK23_OCTDE|nr:transducin-like enhancer protein 6 [Octodon degus]
MPSTLGCSSTRTQDVHRAVTTPDSCNREQKGKGSTLLDLESEDLLSDSWEDLEETIKSHSAAQAPLKGAHPVFLKPTSWDHKELEKKWVRPGAEPGQSESLCVPYQVERLQELQHGARVLSTAVNSFTRHVFTCGVGGLKVWHLDSQGAPATLPRSNLHWPVQTPGAYLRTCLLTPNGSMLLAGGHNMPGVNVWDLSAPSLNEPRQLSCKGLSCLTLDACPKGSLAFAGFSNGTVRIWDLRDPNVVKDLPGRQGEANSIVVKDDTIWIGGLNGHLRYWMPEKACITCCDVSANNRLIIAGAKDWVSVYQVTY